MSYLEKVCRILRFQTFRIIFTKKAPDYKVRGSRGCVSAIAAVAHTAVSAAAAAETDDDNGDDYNPEALIVKKIAKAVHIYDSRVRPEAELPFIFDLVVTSSGASSALLLYYAGSGGLCITRG